MFSNYTLLRIAVVKAPDLKFNSRELITVPVIWIITGYLFNNRNAAECFANTLLKSGTCMDFFRFIELFPCN